MTGSETTSGEAISSHPLQMHGRGVFYSFSFDLGPGLDIAALAHNLLEKDMAAEAASPANDDIRVPKRGAELDRKEDEAYRMSEFITEMYSEDISWRRLYRHNRKLTLKIAWLQRNQLIKYYSSRLLFGHSGQSVDSPSDDDDDTPEWVAEKTSKMAEISDGYRDMLLDEHILGAARMRLEQSLYFPGYLETDPPFIRVEMNPVYYSDKSHSDTRIEISLWCTDQESLF
ncbi:MULTISPECIES: hypothetical protein [Mycobacteriaceae]|uniref:Uncharacterized protein n=1 Tax=Mycolicibacterium parafortuitum TaxID=39692 RepID=A0ACC6MPM0_MYCPF|nr:MULTISPECIES: hypothetical protein [Mycobacteriaceae]MDZ5088953.1 hypothetical protein [Mycolicibacterium parafortuitum]GFM21398.1 putative uncharacterized protein [Mycobacterium sp. PO1]GFM27089.1 putative uncharacterized protein [Mycobacterium sp. PO2]